MLPPITGQPQGQETQLIRSKLALALDRGIRRDRDDRLHVHRQRGGLADRRWLDLVAPLMAQWIADYKTKAGTDITYGSVGSGAGIQQVSARGASTSAPRMRRSSRRRHRRATAACRSRGV